MLEAVKLTPRKLRAGKAAKLSFRLSEAAAVEVAVLRRSGRKLKALSPLAAGAGATNARFSSKALKPGAYKLRLSAVDTAGNTAKPVTVTFRITRT